MALKARLRWTPVTVLAAVLAFAGFLLAVGTADEIRNQEGGNALLSWILVILAFAGAVSVRDLLSVRRYVAYLYFGIGVAVLIVSLVTLGVIPSASASALPGLPAAWLTVLISAGLFLLAGAAELYEVSRSGR